jgi:hypothetical protein
LRITHFSYLASIGPDQRSFSYSCLFAAKVRVVPNLLFLVHLLHSLEYPPSVFFAFSTIVLFLDLRRRLTGESHMRGQIISMQFHVFVHCTERSPSIVLAFSDWHSLHRAALFSGFVRECWYKIQVRHFWLPSIGLYCLARLLFQPHNCDTACSRGVFTSASALSIPPCGIYLTQNNPSALLIQLRSMFNVSLNSSLCSDSSPSFLQ